MANKNIILITRTWCDKRIKQFIENIHEELSRIIVLVNLDEENNCSTKTEKELQNCNGDIQKKLKIVDVKPWGDASGALNIGLNEAFTSEKEPEQILIASKEVDFNKEHIRRMSKILNNNPYMLVVGYALKTDLKNLTDLEKGHSFEFYVPDTLRVPWNTCAMWNADLFLKNVKSFLNICDYPEILGVKGNIKLQGMEDALAIALAIRNNPKLEIGLIHDCRKWRVNKNNIHGHKEKMKRKCFVYDKYEEFFGKFNKIDVKEF